MSRINRQRMKMTSNSCRLFLRALVIVMAISSWMDTCYGRPSVLDVLSKRAATSEWTAWSPWSKCSTSCQVGIRSRSRVCNHSFHNSSLSLVARSSKCRGKSTEHSICGSKEQSCQKSAKDARGLQCNLHAGRMIGNQRIESWLPSGKASNPCELNCWAENHNFSYGFGKVDDGTPCFEEEQVRNICLNGRCVPVGCDDIVGSPKTYDACGVCGGQNHTCYRVNGICTRNKSWSAGGNLNYAEVVSIPVGATNILIRDSSHSHLALLDNTRSPIINGHGRVDPPGDNDAGGTTFHYSGDQGNVETLMANGPTTTVVYIMAILRDQNPKIYFEYWIPRNATKELNSLNSTARNAPLSASLNVISSNIRNGPSIKSAHQTSSSKRHPNTIVESSDDNNDSGLPEKKPKESKGRKCQRCSRGRNIKQQFCNSDFVLQAKVVNYEETEGIFRYELEVIRSFKNSIPLQTREYLWIQDGCRCPKMNRHREYLIMGRSEKSVTRREMRLVATRNSYVRRYGHRRALKMLQIKRNESKLCGNVKPIKRSP